MYKSKHYICHLNLACIYCNTNFINLDLQLMIKTETINLIIESVAQAKIYEAIIMQTVIFQLQPITI